MSSAHLPSCKSCKAETSSDMAEVFLVGCGDTWQMGQNLPGFRIWEDKHPLASYIQLHPATLTFHGEETAKKHRWAVPGTVIRCEYFGHMLLGYFIQTAAAALFREYMFSQIPRSVLVEGTS